MREARRSGGGPPPSAPMDDLEARIADRGLAHLARVARERRRAAVDAARLRRRRKK